MKKSLMIIHVQYMYISKYNAHVVTCTCTCTCAINIIVPNFWEVLHVHVYDCFAMTSHHS